MAESSPVRRRLRHPISLPITVRIWTVFGSWISQRAGNRSKWHSRIFNWILQIVRRITLRSLTVTCLHLLNLAFIAEGQSLPILSDPNPLTCGFSSIRTEFPEALEAYPLQWIPWLPVNYFYLFLCFIINLFCFQKVAEEYCTARQDLFPALIIHPPTQPTWSVSGRFV